MTDKPYTPTVVDMRRSYFEYRSEFGFYDPAIYDEFDRWHQAELAAAEQRGAIKALRSVATQMESTADTLSELWEHYMLPGDIIAWLRHRADQMEGDDE